jgi:hypothetical protein
VTADNCCPGFFTCGLCGGDTTFCSDKGTSIYWCPRCDIAECYPAAEEGGIWSASQPDLRAPYVVPYADRER